jgi:hypothetical protein
MPELFLSLDPHPVRKAIEVVSGKVRRHREVEIERKEFGVDLFVQSLFDLWVHWKLLFRDGLSREIQGRERPTV